MFARVLRIYVKTDRIDEATKLFKKSVLPLLKSKCPESWGDAETCQPAVKDSTGRSASLASLG